MARDDADGFRSERDFMDALRVLKARSGLSYRDIAARMSRTDPRHALARSTLASLLAGNSVPRRPGQVAALVEVLAAELNEPGQIPRYLQAWSRLIAARSAAKLPAAPGPAPSAPVAAWAPVPRPATPGYVQPRVPRCEASTPPPEDAFSGRQLGALLFWLIVLTIIAYVMWASVPPSVVPFWVVWLLMISPLPFAALASWLGRDRRRSQVDLSEMPAEYVRTEYRHSRPGAGPGLAGLWPG